MSCPAEWSLWSDGRAELLQRPAQLGVLLRGVDDPLAGHHRVDRLAHRVRACRGAVRVPLDRPAGAEDDVRAELAHVRLDGPGVHAAADHREGRGDVRAGQRELLDHLEVLQPPERVAAVRRDRDRQVATRQPREQPERQRRRHARARALEVGPRRRVVGEDRHPDHLGQALQPPVADRRVGAHDRPGTGVHGSARGVEHPVRPVRDVREVDDVAAGLVPGALPRGQVGLDPVHHRGERRVAHQLVVLDEVDAAQGRLVEDLGTGLRGQPGARLDHVEHEGPVVHPDELAHALDPEPRADQLLGQRVRHLEVDELGLHRRRDVVADRRREQHRDRRADVHRRQRDLHEVPAGLLRLRAEVDRRRLQHLDHPAQVPVAHLGGHPGHLDPRADRLPDRVARRLGQDVRLRGHLDVVRRQQVVLAADGLAEAEHVGGGHKRSLRRAADLGRPASIARPPAVGSARNLRDGTAGMRQLGRCGFQPSGQGFQDLRRCRAGCVHCTLCGHDEGDFGAQHPQIGPCTHRARCAALGFHWCRPGLVRASARSVRSDLPNFAVVLVLGLLVVLSVEPDAAVPAPGVAVEPGATLVLAAAGGGRLRPGRHRHGPAARAGSRSSPGTPSWPRSPRSAWSLPRFAETREYHDPAVLGHRELIIAVTALVAGTRAYQAGELFLALVGFAVVVPVVMAVRRIRLGAARRSGSDAAVGAAGRNSLALPGPARRGRP